MKNLIIEAGKKLGEHYRTQLGGQMTDASSKTLCAMAKGLLTGAQYDQVWMLLAICDRYHVLTKYCASNIDWTVRAQEALNTLVSGAMLANNFAVYATALVVMICDGEAEGEKHALELIASGGVLKTVAPQPVPQPTQPQPIFPQPTPPQVNWADFDVSGDTLVAYKGNQKYVTVPDGITKIGDKAFYGNINVENVTIPEGVVSIEEDAFCGCTSLSSITLPDSVKKIGRRAFEGCTGLVSVSIGSGVTSIGRFAFNGCKKLKSLVIPDNVKKIGSCALQGCTGLEAITVSGDAFDGGSKPKPLGYIFGFETSGCIEVKQKSWASEVASSYYIPKSLKSVTIKGSKVPYGFLSSCTEIKSVTISGGITSIEYAAFSGCIGLTEIVIPDTVKRIEAFSFDGCRNLRSLELPSSVDSIGNFSFAKCIMLATVVINSGLKTIGKNAFSFCVSLKSITIPKSVKKIGAMAFMACPDLTIYKEGGLALWDLFGTSWNPEKRPVKKV